MYSASWGGSGGDPSDDRDGNTREGVVENTWG